MSNRAGSATALQGVARRSPGAHASACNTASRTKLLLVFIHRPPCIVLVPAALYEPSAITTRERGKTPGSFSLRGSPFDVHVIRAIAPDGRAESIPQHRQQ